ncbi:MAG: zinc-dependent metalloprotease [Cyclobacteriaceae bacterium]
MSSLNRSLICFTIFISCFTTHAQSLLDSEGIQHFTGYFNFHYLEDQDEIFMEVNTLETPFLYVSALSEGLGSNDLFLDRGQIGGSRIVQFRKAGNKLLLIQPNMKYRAITANPLEKKSVQEAFAKSVLFGFPIMEQTPSGYVINLTPFLFQDTHGVTDILKDKNQGNFSVDPSRSALNMEKNKGFPKNVDFDVLITLSGDASGSELKSVTPDNKHVTVFQHHSFVELPDEKYEPRKFHPNAGGFSLSFQNYAAPINESMEVEYVVRHRLAKKDPAAAISEPVEPIIYYLDNGTPEPVRTALLEGAGWWNEAFESIGYKDAFQIKVLPDTVDPLDIRYNVIQWVHRSTRGWSYGNAVEDPRTGEIIKGHVSLGSLRVRQDYMIAKALSKAPFGDGNDATPELLEFALSRIRQLSAHEVGHTLGLAHNFAASIKDRASVMDYPHPWVKIRGGEIDISEAYDNGIGSWDKVTIAYAYSDFADDEAEKLQAILENAFDEGHRYVSDADARPAGGANAYGHLWDNGEDPVAELNNVLAVRKLAIDQFGLDNMETGEGFDDLEDLFVLLYFYHRYQTEAATKLIAGVDYGYALKSEVEDPAKVVSPEKQREALNSVLKTLDAQTLAVPENKLKLFAPRSYGDRDRESFKTLTGPTFDPLSAATTAADYTLTYLLHPERVARLINQHATSMSQLGFEEVLDKLFASTLEKSYEYAYLAHVQDVINHVALAKLMALAQHQNSYRQVKDLINEYLSIYLKDLKRKKSRNTHENGNIRLIENYFKDPTQIPEIKVPKIPDGSPIGMFECGSGRL